MAARAAADDVYVRVNQLGYRPGDVKVAVAMARAALPAKFQVVDASTQKAAFEGERARNEETWGKFNHHAQLDFSKFDKEGEYFVRVGDAKSSTFRISASVYAELPDQLLEFMRQQRCGYNPWVDAVCHSFDGRTVDGPLPAGSYVDARGGWHDAGDQLKYLLTSSNATAQMLLAYQLGKEAKPQAVFGDRVNALGQPVPNGIADLLDEARWGLDWMLRLHPAPDQLYHQVADDRDHSTGFRQPQDETVDYGWGKGSYRPVYSADGKPQGLMQYKSESNGVANLAGRYAAAMGLGYQIWKRRSANAAVCRTVSRGRQRSLCDGQSPRRRSARQFLQVAVSICGDDLGRRHGMGRGRIIPRDWRLEVSDRCIALRRAGRNGGLVRQSQDWALSVLSVHECRPLSALRFGRQEDARTSAGLLPQRNRLVRKGERR